MNSIYYSKKSWIKTEIPLFTLLKQMETKRKFYGYICSLE
jgi:hypothetical protein